jgi:hypothetical protein
MADKNDIGANFPNLLYPLGGFGFAIAEKGIGGKCMTSVKPGVASPSFRKRWQVSKEMFVLKAQYWIRVTSRGLRHLAKSGGAPWILVIPNREIMIPANDDLCLRTDIVNYRARVRAVVDQVTQNPKFVVRLSERRKRFQVTVNV